LFGGPSNKKELEDIGNNRKFPKGSGTSGGNSRAFSTSIIPFGYRNPDKIAKSKIPKMVILSIPGEKALARSIS
jgi:hypothetical protein